VHPADLVVVGWLGAGLGTVSGVGVFGGSFAGEEVEEGSVTGELLLGFCWDLGPTEHHEGEVFGIDVSHLLEMVQQFSDVGFGPPYEDHAVAEHLLGKRKSLLNIHSRTKDSMEVERQSTFMKMPCTWEAQVAGSAVGRLTSEWRRQELAGGRGGCCMSSRHAKIW
jgi:hypothetical protein